MIELPDTDHRSLATTLAPVLVEACDNRLEDLVWFKADWQAGGAATGTAVHRLVDGKRVRAVVKLPVVQRELVWTRRLQDDRAEDLVVPRLYASGETLGGYDLAWVVIERFEYGPLGLHWHDEHIPRIAEAAARFHAATSAFPIDQTPTPEPWDSLLREAQHSVKINNVAEHRRWTAALKTLRRRQDALAAQWEARPTTDWLHGDLHLANAMSRTSMESGPVCLIDLAEIRAGHWVEDAIYLERQLWARPQRLRAHKPLKAIAAARKKLGLPVAPDDSRLAMIRRVLLAATTPKFLRSEGHPRYLAACLEQLERTLSELK